MKKFIQMLFILVSLQNMASADVNNILTYEGGDLQINSEINIYDPLAAGQPIHGSIFVTHNVNQPIEINHFFLGDQPLKVSFFKSTSMSAFNGLEVSVYQFTLKGMDKGVHILPPIQLKVGSKTYQADPLVLEIP